MAELVEQLCVEREIRGSNLGCDIEIFLFEVIISEQHSTRQWPVMSYLENNGHQWRTEKQPKKIQHTGRVHDKGLLS